MSHTILHSSLTAILFFFLQNYILCVENFQNGLIINQIKDRNSYISIKFVRISLYEKFETSSINLTRETKLETLNK